MKKVMIGMSGGVDSTVAAYLLKQDGYEVAGMNCRFFCEDEALLNSGDDTKDAEAVCKKLDIPFFVSDLRKEFADCVIEDFLTSYEKGATPNPCIQCNRHLKFGRFLDCARELGYDCIVTGHYARILQNLDTGRWELRKAADEAKDQSYFLCTLNAHQLEKVEFPVGGYTKEYVRQIARDAGIPVADKKNSTGICFIGERNFRKFLQGYLPAQPGQMRTTSGEYIGQHQGLMYYTLGQRRGLNIGGRGTGESWFVVDKDLKNNILYVEQGADSPKLYSKVCVCSDFSFVNPLDIKEFDCTAKFRYRQPDQKVHVYVEGDQVLIESYEKQRAITPGQYAVLYSGDECLGGGPVNTILE